ncbi:hypothetical protein [Yinghuangia soli]|uniref:Uncharacterized protein n=1 Tax=Yinghuangia soli TaxID=2908204 RepID=A0AA41Q7S8_9ACTN|nr:hypothetical protein [Yinghuangia soli]MCF2533163.1 hypothetical protein [Yinghuangia soli]
MGARPTVRRAAKAVGCLGIAAVALVAFFYGMAWLAYHEATTGPHYDIADSELAPVRELVEVIAPGTAVRFERDECTAGEDGETSENATSRTPVSGDPVELGRRLHDAARARGWPLYEVRGALTGYADGGRFTVAVARTPQGGAVVLTAVASSACDGGAPALPGDEVKGGDVVGPVVTDKQRAAAVSVVDAAMPVLGAIHALLPERFTSLDAAAPALAGGPEPSTAHCQVRTPAVGVTSSVHLPYGHVAAPPATPATLADGLGRVAAEHGWTRTPGNDPLRIQWTKQVGGLSLTLDAQFRIFDRLNTIYVMVGVTSSVCTPYG